MCSSNQEFSNEVSDAPADRARKDRNVVLHVGKLFFCEFEKTRFTFHAKISKHRLRVVLVVGDLAF